MVLFKSEYEMKVSFEDLDPMNIVWHGNYMKYLEHARCDLLSKLNYTYMDFKKDGVAYPIAKFKAKYIKPALFEDVLKIVTVVETIEPSINMKYEIYKKSTGEKIFEAKTMQIGIKIKTGESIYNPPKRFIEAIERVKNEIV